MNSPFSDNSGATHVRILVAADDFDLRRLLTDGLRQQGCEVIEAADGHQTLARAIDSAPSVILLDAIMPGMDGFDACRRLKSNERTSAVPIIFVSARNDPRSREEELRLGADSYLAKPFRLATLIQHVRMAIQRQAIRQLFDSVA
ncbi:MAG TPA: response regulator [Anaerolineae bacterium]